MLHIRPRKNALQKKILFLSQGRILIPIFFLLVVGGVLLYKFLIPAPQPVLRFPNDSLKIAYIKKDGLFVVDTSGITFVTSMSSSHGYTFSPDGKSLAWINTEIINTPNDNFPQGKQPNAVGMSVMSIDLNTKQKKELVAKIHTNEEFLNPLNSIITDSIKKYSLYDIAFVDPKTIVYIRGGVILKDLATGLETMLVANGSMPDTDAPFIMKAPQYLEVVSNKKNNTIQLLEGGFECDPGFVSVYSVKKRDFENLGGAMLGGCDSMDTILSPDGRYVVSSDRGGNVEEGLWIGDINKRTRRKLLDHGLSFVSITNQNKIFGYKYVYRLDTTVPGTSAIYAVNMDGSVEKIKEVENVIEATVSPDGTYLLYLVESNGDNAGKKQLYDLHYLVLKDRKDLLLLKDIISYHPSF